MDDRRRRARAGLVELAVRGQRRVRARLPARRRPAHRARPPAARRAARRGRTPTWSTRSWTRRSSASRSSARSASGWPSSSGASTGSTGRPSPTCAAWSTTWSGAASGSSAATAGPTTSAPAGSTTCWPAAATSTCSCSTPRCTPTPAARCRRRRRSARSPSSPRPARRSPKKDLALQAIAYGNVYVARVAMGADPQQTLSAFREAEAYDGPSLVIAYSHCIAHGIDMRERARPAVPRRRQRLLAADPLRPDGPRRRRQPVPARLAAAADPACRLHLPRAALPHAGQHRPGRGRAAARARRTGGRPTLAGVRGDGDPWRAPTSPPTRGGRR